MVTQLSELAKLLNGLGIFYIILILIIFAFIIKPDLANQVSLVMVGFLTFLKWARRTKVSSSFELGISQVTNKLNDEIGEDILPSNPKIKWVKNTTKEAFLKDGKMVVKLDYHDDKNRTFALATVTYVNKGLLPTARQYISKDVMETCSLLVTRRIISDNNDEALDFFVSNILSEVFLEKPNLKVLYNELTDLDNNAMFLQILIPELWKMGNRIYPNNINNQHVSGEIEKLIKYLHAIATKKYDEEAKLNLDSNLFKLRVILVGRVETLDGHGIDPYLKRVKEGIKKGYKSIYLLGYERKSEYMKELKKRLKNNKNIKSIKIREGNVLNKNFDNMKCICVGLTTIDVVPNKNKSVS